MKLQPKISLILVVSMLAASLLSFVLINLVITLFDRSYSWYDLDKVALEAARDLGALPSVDAAGVGEKLLDWKRRYPNLNFTVFNNEHEFIFTTDPHPRRPPSFEDVRRRLEEEERRVRTAANSLRFVDSIDRSPFMVAKPVVINDQPRGMLMVSVRNDFFLPFYIRINDEKILESSLIVFAALAAVIALSFLLVFLLTTPLIRRLRLLYNRINGFELGVTGASVPDPERDELGIIQNTFNSMARRIQQDYAERVRTFKERQELLRNLSHDFRTPLTSILGYAVSLEEGVYDDEAERKKYVSIIRKKAEYMTKLFDEMMELTRLDSETYVLHTSHFSLAELLREILIEELPRFEAAGFTIETGIPEILDCTGDKARLSRALRNLIDNVLTHATGGKYLGIFLSADGGGQAGGSVTSGVKDSDRVIRLRIQDRGPGVARGDTAKIFERFYSGSEGRTLGGTGLGLAIAKEIIEKHGGTMGVESDDAPGAVFTVSLPG